MVDAKLTDHNYESKGQEFGCNIFEELPPLNNDTTEIIAIDYLLDTPNLKHLQMKVAYFKCIGNYLQIPSVQKHLTLDNDTFTDRHKIQINASKP